MTRTSVARAPASHTPLVRPAAPVRPSTVVGISNQVQQRLVQRDTRSPYSIDEGTIIETDEEPVQAKQVAGASVAGARSLETGIGRLTTGAPLPGDVRGAMESRLGRDLGAVRVHTGSQAERLAGSINARAFTLGADVVFGAGQYDPASPSGARLLAHELVHVAQQGRAPLVPRVTQPSSDRALDISDRADPRRAWRVKWNPNTATGRRVKPWGTGPDGEVRSAASDAGTALDIWRPDNGSTYWCHGYTFGGSVARGGPYSIWGSDVPTVLADDGWRRVGACVASIDDILVFWDRNDQLVHSGRIAGQFAVDGKPDESVCTLESKWGNGPHDIKPWADNIAQYGGYRAYSKSPAFGPCPGRGDNELP